MKNINLLTFYLLFSFIGVNAQTNVFLDKDFFTTENIKVAIALGYDTSPLSKSGESTFLTSLGNIDDKNISYRNSSSYSVGFDIFSQQSTLGFLINPTLNFQNFTLNESRAPLKDSIAVSNFEIPVYLKLRLGNPLNRSQFWLALGAGYSIPFNTQQNYIDKSNDRVVANREENDMFKSIPFLSGIIGYEINLSFSDSNTEIYERDGIRMLLFVKSNYDLANRFNTNFNSGTNTSFGTIQEPDLRFFRVSVGVKLLVRISKAMDIANKASREMIKQ